MKILRISEITKSSNNEIQGDKLEPSKNTPKSDEVTIYSKSYIRNLLNEMKEIQEEASFLNTKLEALKELNSTINEDNNISENTKAKIKKLIESKRFNNQKVLEDVEASITSAKSKSEMYSVIAEKLSEIDSRLEELKRISTTIVIKASNINQTIGASSQSELGNIILTLDNVTKSISSLKNAQNINPNSVIKIISKNDKLG
jgi:DNA repair ATPase RecN